jgi:hypothetical protein
VRYAVRVIVYVVSCACESIEACFCSILHSAGAGLSGMNGYVLCVCGVMCICCMLSDSCWYKRLSLPTPVAVYFILIHSPKFLAALGFACATNLILWMRMCSWHGLHVS